MSASTPLPSLPWPSSPAGGGAPSRALPMLVPVAAAAVLGAAIAAGSPVLIAIALAPLALALIARPDGALLLFAAGIYLNLPVVIAHSSNASSVLSSSFALLLVVPFLAYVVIGRRPLVLTPTLALMIGYLVAMVLSATVAAGGTSSTVNPIVNFLAEGLLLYVLLTNVVRTPNALRAVIWVVILAGAIMGVVSLWQEITHSYANSLHGFATVDRSALDVGNQISGKSVRARLAGPIGEKNRYAQILLVLVPLAVSRMRVERRRGLRLLAAACAALIVCGIMLTFSRGAAIAMLVLVVAMTALRMVAVRHVLVLALALVALVLVVAPDYVTRIQTLAAADSALAQGGTADNAIKGRATENLAAYYVFRDHPLLGVGPSQFFQRYSEQYGNALDLRFLSTNRRAHNLYLEIAADTGALGLALFLAIVGVTAFQLWRLSVFWRRRSLEMTQLALAFLLAVIAYLATGAFLQLAYQRYFWFLIALANATIWILRRESARALADEAAGAT